MDAVTPVGWVAIACRYGERLRSCDRYACIGLTVEETMSSSAIVGRRRTGRHVRGRNMPSASR